MTAMTPKSFPLAAIVVAATTWGCSGSSGSNDPSKFTLKFEASAGGEVVTCADTVTGLGPAGSSSVGMSDLRFYVSNLKFYDSEGNAVTHTLDQNEFQYVSEAGSVVLVDLTSNTEGTCADSAIAFAEGTARTNPVVTGATAVEDVTSVSFDVGVPQGVMKEVIATNTAEGAPSPLGEMFWSWATGYRHFVWNFAVTDSEGAAGDGYLHVGSRDCGADGTLALEDREACGLVNTPTVRVDGFDLSADTMMIDLPSLLSGVDFVAPIYDPETFEVIGMGPGVECHSSPMQAHCGPVFTSLGLDLSTGAANTANNRVFRLK